MQPLQPVQQQWSYQVSRGCVCVRMRVRVHACVPVCVWRIREGEMPDAWRHCAHEANFASKQGSKIPFFYASIGDPMSKDP